jgi:hypothetical protein
MECEGSNRGNGGRGGTGLGRPFVDRPLITLLQRRATSETSDFVNNVPRAYEEVLHILSLKARIISTESPFGGAE